MYTSQTIKKWIKNMYLGFLILCFCHTLRVIYYTKKVLKERPVEKLIISFSISGGPLTYYINICIT